MYGFFLPLFSIITKFFNVFKNLFSQDLKHIWRTKCPWRYMWIWLSLGVLILLSISPEKKKKNIYIITEKNNTFASPQKSIIPTLWNSETRYNLAALYYKKCWFFGFPTFPLSFFIVFSLIYDLIPRFQFDLWPFSWQFRTI